MNRLIGILAALVMIPAVAFSEGNLQRGEVGGGWYVLPVELKLDETLKLARALKQCSKGELKNREIFGNFGDLYVAVERGKIDLESLDNPEELATVPACELQVNKVEGFLVTHTLFERFTLKEAVEIANQIEEKANAPLESGNAWICNHNLEVFCNKPPQAPEQHSCTVAVYALFSYEERTFVDGELSKTAAKRKAPRPKIFRQAR